MWRTQTRRVDPPPNKAKAKEKEVTPWLFPILFFLDDGRIRNKHWRGLQQLLGTGEREGDVKEWELIYCIFKRLLIYLPTTLL